MSHFQKQPSNTSNFKYQLEQTFPTTLKTEFQNEIPLSYTPKAKYQLEIAFCDNPKAIFHKIFVYSHWMKVQTRFNKLFSNS